jgi:hypothetical protein
MKSGKAGMNCGKKMAKAMARQLEPDAVTALAWGA